MAKRNVDESLCDSYMSRVQRSTSTAKAVTTPIDVICQHSKDGTVVPLKIRVCDDDGEYQAYAIQGFQEQEHRGGITTKDGVYVSSHIVVYECQITTFGYKRKIRLYYDEQSGIWSMCG